MSNDENREFIENPPAPRLAKNAERPGEYRVAIRAREAEVDPGGDIHLEAYFTGYGEIQGAKLVFHPPPYFIEEQQSTVFMDAGEVSVGTETRMVFGAREVKFTEFGGTPGILAKLGGLVYDGWKMPTYFVDTTFKSPTAVEENVATLLSERKLGPDPKSAKAPFELILKVRENAPSGQHNLRFYFTYFNGEQWKTDSQAVSVLVRSWVRRHETITVVAGIIVAMTALLAAVGSFILDLLTYFCG